MADGVEITAGSGTEVATDDAGAAGHVQIIKLAISANGDATVIPADATYGMYVDVKRMPGADRTTDNVGAADVTDAIMQDTTALTPKWAVIDVASSGDNTIVSAVSSKKIRVVSCFMVAAAAVTVRFESGASGTAKTGQMQLAANSGFVLPYNPVGWFETAATTLLNLELSGNISVDGVLVYVEAS